MKHIQNRSEPREFTRFAEKYLQRNADGTFAEFFTTIRYLFGSSGKATQ